MNLRTARAKLAALAVLFFLGTFAGQIQHVLDSLRGRVDRGTRVVEDFKATVTTIGQAVDGAMGGLRGTTDAVAAQVADLQAKLAAGTATPAQVAELHGLLERLRLTAARPGPAGPVGPPGPPGTASSSSPPQTTTSTTAGGTTTTTRPAPAATTTTTRPRSSSTTTTTRCVVGVGQLVKVGC